jgi:hypothetical protein
MPKTLSCIALLVGLALGLTGCQLPTERWNAPPSGSVLFQDDFSNAAGRWQVTLGDVGLAGAYKGTFRFVVRAPETQIWSTPGLDFASARLEVDAARFGGPEENRMGLICRYRSPEDYYFFIISADGYYAIGKVTGGTPALIGQEQMQYSSAIQTGWAINHLRADCIGDTLTFYVNYLPVALVHDGDHTVGDVGLVAGSFEQTGVDVIFDNFIVLQP